MDPALSTGLALAVVVVTLVALVSIWLLRGARAAKKARRTWEAAIEARFREHGGHSGRLMLLERVLDAHVAAHQFDVRQTVARPRPTDAQLAAARPGATAAALEAAQLPEPAVDSDGDRGGINPGDPIPDSADLKAAIRARLEAEADARDIARDDQAPSPRMEPGSDRRPVPMDQQTERTMLGAGRPRAPHPLAGIEPERPTSSATRTADAFRRRHGSSPTLISAGVAPGLLRSAPGPTTLPDAPAHDSDTEANP